MVKHTDLSADQRAALARVGTWFTGLASTARHCDDAGCGSTGEHTHGVGPAPVLSLGGLAGTGKTSIIQWLEAALAAKVSYGTPTHKAARVLRAKLDRAQAARVNTYHSLVFTPRPSYVCLVTGRFVSEARDDQACVCGSADCVCPRRFEPCGRGPEHLCRIDEQLNWEDRPNLPGHLDLLVVDEASMLSEEHVEKIRAFGVPMLLVGDHGQLPPVKAVMNRWVANPDVMLTENHRQRHDTSGIVDLALAVRAGTRPALGFHGDGRSVVVKRDNPGVTDLLQPERYEGSRRGRPAIICPTNRLRANLNKRFHGEGPPRAGDEVIALRRCLLPVVAKLLPNGFPVMTGDDVTVHNGQTGRVVGVTNVTRTMIDLIVALDPAEDGAEPMMVFLAAAALAQFGADTQLAINERPAGCRLWDYAYAITAHKSQGSEWRDVLVLDQRPMDYERWMYTAITRARERLVVVRY